MTRQPVEGARLSASDSSWSALSDAEGHFHLVLPRDDVLSVIAEAFGYRAQRFDLDAAAASRLAVFLLEPAPVEIEGINVVEEAAVATLQRNLEQRRNSYPNAVVALDRSALDRFRAASTYEVIRSRVPRIRPCRSDPSALCVPGRTRTFANPNPELPVTVCVDGWRSVGSVPELETLPIESVTLVEIYGGSTAARGAQVRIYTARWMIMRASSGRTRVPPLVMGC